MSRTTLLIFLALLLGGCASIGDAAKNGHLIQTILDEALPADFSGDINISHVNSGFQFEIRAGHLHRTDKGWSWDWLVWSRHGFVSHGSVVLGSPPANQMPR